MILLNWPAMENSISDLQQRVFVALDVPSRERAIELAALVKPAVGGYKIGLELFVSCGPQIFDHIDPAQTFLDLKFHDIPNTAAGAARAAARLGVLMCNVHCLGGAQMMRAAADAAHAENPQTKVLGVTILTSHDAASLQQIGLKEEPAKAVTHLAALAREAGLDGVVCSPQEITAVRETCGENFLIVTPGIRPAKSTSDDQKRTLTPRQALQNGADWIVVGRPITAAENPLDAARRLFDD
jgi:orotidine-5'-phosphate decarboxylase